MQQKRIIVDCMGGDRAPGEMLAGAVAAKAALGVPAGRRPGGDGIGCPRTQHRPVRV